MAIEKPEYTVMEKEGKFEIRQYKARIVAETVVDGNYRSAGNEGFRRLAGYIFGKNRMKNKIAMTSPVRMEGASEKISMTAPVSQSVKGDQWRVTFMMPSKYTLDTLPDPLDSRVILREEPGVLMASLRYSGTWSEERYQIRKERLIELIRNKGYEAIGEPVIARYDPPFKPAFLRRNEVLIPVRKIEQ